ncbi:hypothetical protein [Rhizobium sp. RU35A]|uniref:hypothetical protein n=1 Tax=Rhizobium sp. RU35A TaxID=1907414 RepID=UPI00122C2BAC|nr:hypothetical protein [Rhizobium sp. RU35A]
MGVVVETLREHLPEVDGADAGSGNLQTPPFLMRLIEVLRLKVYRSDRDLQLFTTNGRGMRAPAGLALQSLSEA